MAESTRKHESNRLSNGNLFLTLPSNFSISSGGSGGSGQGSPKGGCSPSGSSERKGSSGSRGSPLHSYTPDDLRRLFLVSLNKMARMEPESLPFRQPVDAEELGIPDYHDIIRKPMDLQTIRNKMNSGKYTEPYAYVDDVLLMLDNAWLYNRPGSKVYEYTTRLSQTFTEEVNPVMHHLGYKQGRTNPFQFNSDVLPCHGRPVCLILKDQGYYRDTTKEIHFNLCESCYNEVFTTSPVTPDVVPTNQSAFVFSLNTCKSYSPAAELHKSHVRDAEMSRQVVLREFLRLVLECGGERKDNVFKMLRVNSKLCNEFVGYVTRVRDKALGGDTGVCVVVGESFTTQDLEGLVKELKLLSLDDEKLDSGVESVIGSSQETLDLSLGSSEGGGE